MTLGIAALCDVGLATAVANELAGTGGSAGITATASGTQATTPILTATISYITTVATQLDSVKLPFAQPGGQWVVINGSTINGATVFGSGNDTVHGVAGSTGFIIPGGVVANFYAPAQGKWFVNLSD